MAIKYELFDFPPKDFAIQMEVAGCFCHFKDKILLVKRHPEKSQGNTWGLPAGKLERSETPRQAVIREMVEEVGFKLSDDLKPLGKQYFRFYSFNDMTHYDFVFHMFYEHFDEEPLVILNEENIEAKFVTLKEAYELPLIIAGEHVLKAFESYITANTHG